MKSCIKDSKDSSAVPEVGHFSTWKDAAGLAGDLDEACSRMTCIRTSRLEFTTSRSFSLETSRSCSSVVNGDALKRMI